MNVKRAQGRPMIQSTQLRVGHGKCMAELHAFFDAKLQTVFARIFLMGMSTIGCRKRLADRASVSTVSCAVAANFCRSPAAGYKGSPRTGCGGADAVQHQACTEQQTEKYGGHRLQREGGVCTGGKHSPDSAEAGVSDFMSSAQPNYRMTQVQKRPRATGKLRLSILQVAVCTANVTCVVQRSFARMACSYWRRASAS